MTTLQMPKPQVVTLLHWKYAPENRPVIDSDDLKPVLCLVYPVQRGTGGFSLGETPEIMRCNILIDGDDCIYESDDQVFVGKSIDEFRLDGRKIIKNDGSCFAVEWYAEIADAEIILRAIKDAQ